MKTDGESRRGTRRKAVVLVGVVKRKRDLETLVNERWYRMPASHAPRRSFSYIAFYQPRAVFGRAGRCIRYYAEVIRQNREPRIALLPAEPKHPRAHEPYWKVQLGPIQKLKRPIRNRLPRRVTFGFTTLETLRSARTVLQLWRVAPTEEMVRRYLSRAGIPAKHQQWIVQEGRRYCLDFAVICRHGKIAIECDNTKAHAGKAQAAWDRRKDAFLKRHGWVLVRLSEAEILSGPEGCIRRVFGLVKGFGGVLAPST